MRKIRLFLDTELAPGALVNLPEAAANHATRVLRLRDGDAVILFNGDGHDYEAQLVLGRREAAARVKTAQSLHNESPITITLMQAVARGEKMDLILQKATELGVNRILPVISERTEVKLDEDRADRRVVHWQRVIESACEQCGRAVLPEIASPAALDRAAALVAEEELTRLVLHPDPADDQGWSRVPASTHFAIAIGPEGGFSERDLKVLDAAGFVRIALGPRILRTETAGIATIAALQTRFGDFA